MQRRAARTARRCRHRRCACSPGTTASAAACLGARSLGEAPDPYRVWLSEIMLQQTTVKAVLPRYDLFLRRWPDVTALARAELGEVLAAWAGLGYYARARNLHACARACSRAWRASSPTTRPACASLPGIGDYTAAAIAAIAFGRRATPVDGNIERVVARLFAVTTPLPAAKAEIRALAETLTPEDRAGDFAQAMMDLGATICTPRRPACGLCPVRPDCRGYAEGIAEALPYREAKGERPVRRGATFVAIRPDGAVLLRERPLRGLLGGMLETPSSPVGRGRPEWKRRARSRAARGGLAKGPRPGRAHLHPFPSGAFRLSRRGRAGRRARSGPRGPNAAAGSSRASLPARRCHR